MKTKLINPKKKSKRKAIILLMISFIIVLSGLAYYYWFTPEEVAEITYQTGKVKQGDLILSIENSGVIQYVEENDVTSTVTGTIEELFVQENSDIEIGDPILSVDDSNTKLQLEQTYTDLKIAKLKLADLLQTTVDKIYQVSVEDLSVITASIDGVIDYSVQKGMNVSSNTGIITITDNQNLNFIIGVPASKIDEIKVGKTVNIDTFAFVDNVSGTVFKISNTVHSNGFEMVNDVWITVQNPGIRKGMTGIAELETATGKLKINGEFDNAVEVTAYSKINGTIDEIYIDNGEYVAKGTPIIKIDTTSLTNQVESQKQSIKSIELKIEQLKLDLENMTVKSTNGGTVNDLYVAPNQAINSNTKIATIVSKRMVANIEIDELDIAMLQLGQEALLFIPAFSNEEISGTVTYMSDTGFVKDGITTYEVHVSLQYNEKIKSGMTVDATILLEKAENVLMVQSSSVIDVKGGKAVRVLNGDQITVKKVEVGISNDTLTEILSGIEPTDIIITSITIPTSESSNTSSNSLVPSSVTIPGISGGPGGGGGK